MKTGASPRVHPASFRDPSGFVFYRNNELYRQVNMSFMDDYDLMMSSGLYTTLADKGLIIRHQEISAQPAAPTNAYKTIKPEMVPFISYPYEWCFSQLKDAALATLEIQKTAIDCGMILKDASAYNIQFIRGRPLLVDTLSFEKYVEGQPWTAYRQFCQHFLAPLALMAHTDIRLSQLPRIHIDGVPLDLASRLLPVRTRLRFGLLIHIHLHAKAQKRYSGIPARINSTGKVSRTSMLGIIDSLEHSLRACNRRISNTEWKDYYDGTNYSESSMDKKIEMVSGMAMRLQPGRVWDMGANNGVFSRSCAGMGSYTVSFDRDDECVEDNYIRMKKNNEENILPLVMDLTNPSPGIGWDNRERESLADRGPADLVLALALIHHLAISGNLPLGRIASTFRNWGNHLIVEFVPKTDSQVQRLLLDRKDIFCDYTQDKFEKEFRKHFRIRESARIPGTERMLYLMQALDRQPRTRATVR